MGAKVTSFQILHIVAFNRSNPLCILAIELVTQLSVCVISSLTGVCRYFLPPIDKNIDFRSYILHNTVTNGLKTYDFVNFDKDEIPKFEYL